MGNPNWSYEDMLREADRIIFEKRCVITLLLRKLKIE